MEIIKPSPLIIVSIAYKRWSFMRGSSYRDFTGKILVMMEVLLYLPALKDFRGKNTFALAMIHTMQC